MEERERFEALAAKYNIKGYTPPLSLVRVHGVHPSTDEEEKAMLCPDQ